MSRLYLTEAGRVLPTLGEELTTWRRARKTLHLPATSSAATLYVLAFAHPPGAVPLRVSVNGVDTTPIRSEAAGAPGSYLWRRATVEPSRLRTGENVLEFWSDATAMDGWALALEPGHAQPQSAVSDDGGATWRNQQMGYLNVLRGEYVARVRLAEGSDPAPPAMTWEETEQPRLARLRSLLPAAARAPGPPLTRARALTAWLSASWEHTSTDRASLYAPWDAETILAWGKARAGHNGLLAITYCVHYAVAFVSCCQALGIPARCAPVWGTVNHGDGHFVAEVWVAARGRGAGSGQGGKWVMVDPNLDAIVVRGGAPLSISEIQELGGDLRPYVEWGPGTAFQRQNPRLATWIETTYLTGVCFRHRSLWPRADFLSHPECSPPAHGATAYCEAGLVWEERDLDRGLGMFPHFAPAAYFDAPPAGREAGTDRSPAADQPR
jgi:transglutaminase-like putative cysteine protease